MASQVLISYIKEQQALHLDEVTLRAALLTHGWTQDQIDEAYIELNTPPLPPVPAPPPIPTVVNSDPSPIPQDVPNGVKGWSWGGFFLTWIWGIGNNVWISLLSLLPFMSFIMAIVLGIKGREWAWNAKKWDSVDHFKSTQRKWAIWGLIINILSFIVSILFFSVFILAAINPQRQLQLAACVQKCQTLPDSAACITSCKANPQSQPSLPTDVPPSYIPPTTPAPTSSNLIPKPTLSAAIPSNKPFLSPTPNLASSPTSSPANSKFSPTGVQTLDNSITAQAVSANLSSNVVTTTITFKNTSSTSQTANLIRLQMHDQNLGTSTKEGYVSTTLAAGESKDETVSFSALPNPPFKIEYAMPNGSLVNLGTYTP